MLASSLSNLNGLTAAKRAVRAFLRPESGVHAALFYGAEGAGKTTISRVLARGWLCQSPGSDGGCGECKACIAFDAGQNVDFLEIKPTGPSLWIKLEDIIEIGNDPAAGVPLVRFIRTHPIQSRHKVVLLEDFDRVGFQAVNSTLKVIEEPFPYVKFILTTRSVGSIVPTVLSRCNAVACETADSQEDNVDWDGIEAFKRMSTPGFIATVPDRIDVLREVQRLAADVAFGNGEGALRYAERLKAIAETLKEDEGGIRFANMEALKLLAEAFGGIGSPEWAIRAAEAHRRIQGNGNAAIVFDSLFMNFGP